MLFKFIENDVFRVFKLMARSIVRNWCEKCATTRVFHSTRLCLAFFVNFRRSARSLSRTFRESCVSYYTSNSNAVHRFSPSLLHCPSTTLNLTYATAIRIHPANELDDATRSAAQSCCVSNKAVILRATVCSRGAGNSKPTAR